MKHFMLDIETTGIDHTKEDLLQIGILECDWDHDAGIWRPGRSFDQKIHTDRSPTSQFAKENMSGLYAACQLVPPATTAATRLKVLAFLHSCGAESPNVFFMGWNASNFDIPFLIHKGILEPSRYETGPDGKDTMVGDFHYRIYEMGGAIALMMDIAFWPTDSSRDAFFEHAKSLDQAVTLPPGKEHDALYDCYAQLKVLNGLILMGRHHSFPGKTKGGESNGN